MAPAVGIGICVLTGTCVVAWIRFLANQQKYLDNLARLCREQEEKQKSDRTGYQGLPEPGRTQAKESLTSSP